MSAFQLTSICDRNIFLVSYKQVLYGKEDNNVGLLSQYKLLIFVFLQVLCTNGCTSIFKFTIEAAPPISIFVFLCDLSFMLTL